MRIIPAIDVMDGKCVRLSQGVYGSEKVYRDNPVELAKEFQDQGIQYLHLVDLDGAKGNGIVHHRILEQIASSTELKVDFGGGIKSRLDAVLAFDCGAAQITLGSIAAKDPELFTSMLNEYGPDRIILGADARNGRIASQGWKKDEGLDVEEFISGYVGQGVRYVVCTDIAKDGMLEGPSEELYLRIIGSSPLHLIASGGVRDRNDLIRLREIGCEGAIVGKALYEGRITLKELAELC